MTNSPTPTLMDIARAEREDLAAFLATLSPQQWEAQSLCAHWSVKDVVAHMISYEELDTLGLVGRFIKGGFFRANEIGVEELRPMSPGQILDQLNRHLTPRGLTAGFGGMIALVDGTINHQDIRRSLGLPRAIPLERLNRVLESMPTNPRLGAWRRIRGISLAATDLNWQTGKGPKVVGTGEALLMAMAGRSVALGELTGPGVPTLASRVKPATP